MVKKEKAVNWWNKGAVPFLDMLLRKVASRKLQVVIMATIFMTRGELKEDNWTQLAIIYILVDGAVSILNPEKVIELIKALRNGGSNWFSSSSYSAGNGPSHPEEVGGD